MSSRQAPVILASASQTRATILRNAGVQLDVMPPRTDEEQARTSLRERGISGRALAEALAMEKAGSVADIAAGQLVIGADQVLLASEMMFNKPANQAGARAQLLALRGQWHELVSAACVLEAGQPPWRAAARAKLHMRDFEEDFVDSYLDRVGAAALESPGSYRIEGLGIQLFDAIEGSHWTILGLPLLPLLTHLRTRGVIAA